ncbi:MAG: hypothetical protein J7L88_04380 [Thermoplasmata archaeon]|nr:hypothetical protein [Thermoplasmata archaeon]
MRKMKRSKRTGAIGIGTLIIFIALILVAAIAAVVIITTAEELENKGRQSKETAKKLTASGIRVSVAEGRVNSGSGEIDQIYLYITLYGMESIDMRDVVLHVITSPRDGTASSQDLSFNENSVGTPDTTHYGTVEVNDPNDVFPYLLGPRVILKLTIDLQQATNLNTLPESSSIEIRFLISEVGHETYDMFYTPSAYPSGGGVVTLLAS